MSQNTLAAIAEEIGRALATLKPALASPGAFKGFALRVGWDLETIPEPVQALVGILAELESALVPFASGDTPTMSQLDTLLDAVSGATDAITALSSAAFDPELVDAGFPSEFPVRVIQFVVCEYLRLHQRGIAYAAKALGIIREMYVPGFGLRRGYVRREIAWPDVGRLLSDPVLLLENAFGWRTEEFDALGVLSAIGDLLISLKIPAALEQMHEDRAVLVEDAGVLPGRPIRWRLNAPLYADADNIRAGVRVLPLPRSGAHLPGIAVMPYAAGDIGERFQLDDHLFLQLRGDFDLQGGVAIRVRPNQPIDVLTGWERDTPSQASGLISARLEYVDPTLQPRVLLGTASGTRLDVRTLAGVGALRLEAADELDLSVEVELQEARLVVAGGEGDGYLAKILPRDGFQATFDLAVGLSTSRGFYFRGTTALEIEVPTHVRLGPIEVNSMTVAVRPSATDVSVAVGASVVTRLGPVTAVAENIGVAGRFTFPGSGGNVGPLDVDLGFKPPTGVGVVIDAGPVTGGGFLAIDTEAGRYMGALQLRIYEISVSAFGVIDTKLPDGTEGFSFVILISAEFTPIQLGLGFTLNGVGGAIGIHRTLSKEALDGAVRTGRLDHILFPKDPAAHAPEILSDLQAFFPPAQGRYTFGPLAKIGWATPTLIEAKIGLILELPHPVRLTLLGTVSAGLPTVEKRFVKLNLAIVGQLDFDKKTFALDASLYDSDVGGFPISGDAALRLAWGRDPTFALAIGGFNPQFQPPAGFPALRRVAVDISPGGSPRVTCQAYLAVTSNTLQVGARAELTAGGHWNIYGWIGFDALFVFSPFGFAADFSAGVALRQGTRKRASVTVHGTLKGPNPWYVKGKACISCFFFDICVGFDVTLSQKRPEAIEPPQSPLAKLMDALQCAKNWSAELPPECDRVVVLAATATPVADPLGTVVVRQKELPLDELITRFAARKLPKEEIATYRIKSVTFRGSASSDATTFQAAREPFARAQFQELPDSKKLSLPAFEPMVAGGRVESAALYVGPTGRAEVRYRTFVVNDASRSPSEGIGHSPAPDVVDALALQGSVATTGVRVSGARKYAAKAIAAPPRVALEPERYAIVSTRTLEWVGAGHGLRAQTRSQEPMSKGRAQALLAVHLAEHPADRGELQVVSEDELPAAAA